MKRLFLLTTAAAGLAFGLGFLGWQFPAVGADLKLPAKAPVQEGGPYFGLWTGLYGGLKIGYGYNWTGTDINAGSTTIATLGNSPHGPVGGVQLGYDTQMGAIVLGLVTDLNLAGFDSTSNMAGLSVSNTTNWYGTTNVRIGLSQFGDHVLPYLQAGAAYGGKKTAIADLSTSTTSFGWDAGGGIETRITKNVSLFIDAKYIDLGATDVPVGIVTGTQKFTFGVAQVGLNYRW